ncbi:MAG: BON domain-containing protein [Anaerolineales bacterium]|nr:BON domain-containing protein [Anaerolineales bacterium]
MPMRISAPLPDESLRAAILAQLLVDERTAKSELRVGVLNGIAHLAGRVDTLTGRAAAEEIAQGVAGVRGVVNRIEAPGAPSPARTVNLNLSDYRFEETE